MILALLLGAVVVLIPSPASAHPLGNFTINHYSRAEVVGSMLRIYYVVDEAEIPTFQDRDDLTADKNAFLASRLGKIKDGLSLSLDGSPLIVDLKQSSVVTLPGQGGLPTLRMTGIFETASLPGGSGSRHHLILDNKNGADHVGWHEVVVSSRGDASVSNSSVPAKDVSNELRSYPTNALQAPLDVTHATADLTFGSQSLPAAAMSAPAAATMKSESGFTSLIQRQHVTPILLLGMLVVAFGFGAAHALAPGHGKSMMAAYLVGTRGRPVDAVLLGVVVSVMHTASVFALGGGLYLVSRNASVERIYPVLTLFSGVFVVCFGAWMIRSRVRTLRRIRAGKSMHVSPHAHIHEHNEVDLRSQTPVLVDAAIGHSHYHAYSEHHQGHEHSHEPHGHTHDMPEDVPPLSRRGLVVLATAGGLLPSPSAAIVLLSAFTLGRVALGLGLVAAFSVGLATALTAVGLALVYGRNFVSQRTSRKFDYLPILSAAALVVVGSVLSIEGINQIVKSQ